MMDSCTELEINERLINGFLLSGEISHFKMEKQIKSTTN